MQIQETTRIQTIDISDGVLAKQTLAGDRESIEEMYQRYLKMLSGRYADTIQLGASTISLIFKSTAALHRQ